MQEPQTLSGAPSQRFLAHQWLVRAEVARARRRRLRIGRDDATQAALLGLHQADLRAAAEMTEREFVTYATFRIRGAVLDEVRAMHPEARRSRGAKPLVPRRVEPGLVEMMREAGLLPGLTFDDSGDPVLLSSEPSPEELVERSEIVALVDAAVRALPERTRVILLRRLAGEIEPAIAADYGVTAVRVSQIARQTARALAALAE